SDRDFCRDPLLECAFQHYSKRKNEICDCNCACPCGIWRVHFSFFRDILHGSFISWKIKSLSSVCRAVVYSFFFRAPAPGSGLITCCTSQLPVIRKNTSAFTIAIFRRL